MNTIKKSVYVTVTLFVLATLYTLAINGFAQTFFKDSANGSIVYVDGEARGSKYIGQNFTQENYFHGRPSVYNYNTYETSEEAKTLPASGGTNYGLSNPNYEENVKANVEKLLQENPGLKVEDIPTDMVTASGSGLDPNISVQGAMIQVERVAKANNLSVEVVENLIKENTTKDMVNVLELNLKLDELKK